MSSHAHEQAHAHDHPGGGGHAHPDPHGGGCQAGHPHGFQRLDGRAGERRRLALALALTAGIMVAEAAGGVLSGSRALLSDAGHMLGDVMAMALSFLALAFAARPADQKRTFGYYRLEILAALTNGVALIVLSGVLLYQVYGRLTAPQPVPIRTSIMLPVAVIGLCANLGGLLLLRGARSLNTRGAYLHVLSDTLSSIAVVVGGLVIRWTGFHRLDAILAGLIAVLIVVSAVRLVKDAVDILLEAVPKGIDLGEVREVIEQVEGVCHVHDLHIWSITSDVYALSGHVVVTPGRVAALCDSDELLSAIKARLREGFRIGHSTLQIESEGYEHHIDDACGPQRRCEHDRGPDSPSRRGALPASGSTAADSPC